MSIDQQMGYIRKALEMGAHVDIKFHNFEEKEKAEKVAAEFSKLSGIPFLQLSIRDTHWFEISNYGEFPSTAIFFDEKEEDKEELHCQSN